MAPGGVFVFHTLIRCTARNGKLTLNPNPNRTIMPLLTLTLTLLTLTLGAPPPEDILIGLAGQCTVSVYEIQIRRPVRYLWHTTICVFLLNVLLRIVIHRTLAQISGTPDPWRSEPQMSRCFNMQKQTGQQITKKIAWEKIINSRKIDCATENTSWSLNLLRGYWIGYLTEITEGKGKVVLDEESIISGGTCDILVGYLTVGL